MPAKSPKSKTAATPADAGETPVKAPARRASARKAAASVDTAPTPMGLDAGLLEQIRTEAYLIWLNEGQPHGRDHDHWVQAEAAVRGRFDPMQQTAE
ncbi:MAG: hypothetical protein RLY86_177 [Pseudomonadota bacterium]